MARLYDLEEGLGVDPKIIPLKGWRRELDIMDIDIPWAPPSPAIPTPDTIYPYSLTVYLEGTNISEGRGTYTPFKVFGAPFIDPENISRALNESSSDAIIFRPIMFKPLFSKYSGSICGGVYIHNNQLINRKRVKTFETSLRILRTIYMMYKDYIELIKRGDKLYIDMLYGEWRSESYRRYNKQKRARGSHIVGRRGGRGVQGEVKTG